MPSSTSSSESMGTYLLLTFGRQIFGGVSIRKHGVWVVLVEVVVKNVVLPMRIRPDGCDSQELGNCTWRCRYPLLVSSRTVYGG